MHCATGAGRHVCRDVTCLLWQSPAAGRPWATCCQPCPGLCGGRLKSKEENTKALPCSSWCPLGKLYLAACHICFICVIGRHTSRS